jgi:hypothetical protein
MLITNAMIPVVLLSATTMAGGCLAQDPEPAVDDLGEGTSALSSDCVGGANGFIDIPDTLTGTLRRSVPLVNSPTAGVTIKLYSGTVAGAQRGWAKIEGATIPGDKVRMDWSTDGFATVRVFCGPFTVTASHQTLTSAAKKTASDPLYQFRACGNLAGETQSTCTAAW